MEKIKQVFIAIMEQKPFVYGSSYILLIPVFAFLYTYCPEVEIKIHGENHAGFISSFYFSVITITTLGYGDITPVGSLSQIFTALESLLGIILIGLFLNSLSHKHALKVQKIEKSSQKEQEQRKAIERLESFNKLVELNISIYLTYTIPVTSPMCNIKRDQFNEDFKFNDMRDLYKSTLQLCDHPFTPAVNYYFKQQHILASLLENMVCLGYVDRWPELEKQCLSFVQRCKEYDFSEYILNAPNMKAGDKKISDSDAELIAKHEGEVKFRHGSGLNAYVALYHLIKGNFEFINTYHQLVKEILNG